MFFSALKIAIRALRRNVLRTFLTMLGMIIGVGAVIAGVSLGTGAKAQVEAQIATLGQNVILVLSGNFSRGGFGRGFGSSPTLSIADYEAIRRDVTGVVAISPEVRAFSQIAVGSRNNNVQVSGVAVDYPQIRSWQLANGDNFTENDVRSAAKVAILGKTTATTLFGEDVDPVGKVIRIKHAPFVVVGTLAAKGMGMMGNDQDDLILVPFTSAMKRLTGDTMFRSFSVQAASTEEMADVQQQIAEILRQRHNITDGKEDDFLVRTQQEISEAATATARIMTIIVGVVAGVSLLVGGIGIMNIMLVSVTERTREIGVRLAVGAHSGDVLLQFLTEAVVLSVAGGMLGIGLGMWCANLLTQIFEFPTLISVSSMVIAFTVSAGIGIVFGFFPALKAANLDPIEALRYE
ncbi:MAG TPA: ABC transporter permease [Candidatus Limnocylindria bacterium]|nr:ABC transporter permease [Candidatus Limnocylindria bacterium]